MLLLLLIPYVLWYLLYRKKSEPTMRVSTTGAYRNAPQSWRQRIIHAPMVLRCLCYIMLVCVLARPQTHHACHGRVDFNACRGPEAKQA